MNDAPMAAEMPIKLNLADLAKPAPAPTISAETSVPAERVAPVTQANARDTLKEIAAGPQPEQAAEIGPNKEKVNTILTQGTQLLLDAGDRRALLLALSRQVDSTPIGIELRRDTIQMIAGINPTKLTPEGQEQLTQLQKEIGSLKLPKTDPSRSEFAKFLETYNKEFPDKAVDARTIESVRTNKEGAAFAITDVLQGDTILSAKLWEQMKGEKLETPNVRTPEAMLKAAGLEATQDNIEKAHKLYEPPKTKEPIAMGDMAMPTIMITALLAILISQLSTPEGGGGGHQ